MSVSEYGYQCPFCSNQFLIEFKTGYYKCGCIYDYGIIKFHNDTFLASFKILDYKFTITDKETLVVDMTPGKKTYDVIRINYSYFVDRDNYLQIIEKMKMLQIFN